MQMYKAMEVWGLYLFDKKLKRDEEGHLWIHLLYRTGLGWSARQVLDGGASGGARCHNHFDWLEFGNEAADVFEEKIAHGRQLAEDKADPARPAATLSQERRTSSVPGKRKMTTEGAQEPPGSRRRSGNTQDNTGVYGGARSSGGVSSRSGKRKRRREERRRREVRQQKRRR